MNHSKFRLFVVLLAGLMQPAEAIILYGLDNSANQTDPLTGVPFSGVGYVSNLGTSQQGSAIHLGGGYMLTADHVGNRSHVTFDGVTYYERDLTYIPTQVAAGVDLKVFKLTTTPTVAAANLYSGGLEEVAPATQIGWGRGRDPAVPVDSAAVTWGANTTIAKRWGLNTPTYTETYAEAGYSYEAIVTVLGAGDATSPGLGANEAAATQYDSGSGLFQNIGGTWYLIGLTTSVDTFSTSNFGEDVVTGAGKGDANYFVRVGSYQSNILALIPEPSASVLLGCAFFALLSRRRVTRD